MVQHVMSQNYVMLLILPNANTCLASNMFHVCRGLIINFIDKYDRHIHSFFKKNIINFKRDESMQGVPSNWYNRRLENIT